MGNVSSTARPTVVTEFVILKSADGRHWQRQRRCPDFTTAAGAAELLRRQNPEWRFRVDVEAVQRSRAGESKGGIGSSESP